MFNKDHITMLCTARELGENMALYLTNTDCIKGAHLK